jgi:hypothetical protein
MTGRWPPTSRRERVKVSLCGGDRLFVLNNRERFVEVAKAPAPFLVLSRATKPLGVVLETISLDEQQVMVGALEAARQTHAMKASHACN